MSFKAEASDINFMLASVPWVFAMMFCFFYLYMFPTICLLPRLVDEDVLRHVEGKRAQHALQELHPDLALRAGH